MSTFKISNKIFEMNLSPKAVVVYAYFLSLYSPVRKLNDEYIVSVKQSTIAEKCCIGSLQTVRSIITLLTEQSLITPLERNVKRNKHKGTYEYEVKRLPEKDGYFNVERKIFGQLNPRQMYVYLFLCKAESIELNFSWNSYNDIAEQTGMRRELVIQTINELAECKHIVRIKRKSKENRNVYVDNRYQIIKYILGSINKKKVRMLSQNIRTSCCQNLISNTIIKNYFSTFSKVCQDFFSVRGSP